MIRVIDLSFAGLGTMAGGSNAFAIRSYCKEILVLEFERHLLLSLNPSLVHLFLERNPIALPLAILLEDIAKPPELMNNPTPIPLILFLKLANHTHHLAALILRLLGLLQNFCRGRPLHVAG